MYHFFFRWFTLFFLLLGAASHANPLTGFWESCLKALKKVSRSPENHPSHSEQVVSDRTNAEGVRVIHVLTEGGVKRVEVQVPGRPAENFTITNRGIEELSKGTLGTAEGLSAYPPELLDAKVLASQDVLDLGCGGGAFVRDLSKISEASGIRGKNKLGVDPFLDESQVQDSTLFREGRAENMPKIPDASFDTVFSNYNVFLYEMKPGRYVEALREITRYKTGWEHTNLTMRTSIYSRGLTRVARAATGSSA